MVLWRLWFIRFSLKEIIGNWVFWLVLITGFAIIIRSIPGWTNAAWGCDFGIYLSLTKDVALHGEFFPDYFGWGTNYNYFPVLYAVNAFAHWVTGIDIVVLMPKLTPVFGGLSVLVFYFVVYELFKDRRIALLSSLFLAVLPFHVYQTSHASPLTMGHFFMILSLYFFIKFRQKNVYFVPLIVSTLLLIMSHHLTTYFYLISLIFIILLENTRNMRWTVHLKKDFFYTFITSVLIFSYWAFVATPIYEGVMKKGVKIGGFELGSNFTIILFFVLFFSIFVFIKMIWKMNKFLDNIEYQNYPSWILSILNIFRRLNPFAKKKYPSTRSRFLIFVITFVIIGSSLIFFTVFKLPWTNFSFTWFSNLYSIPLVLSFCFGAAGFRFTAVVKNGSFVRGWIVALVASFVFALATDSTVFFPHRHFEYIMAPLSIMMAYGVFGLFINFKTGRIPEKIGKFIDFLNKDSKKKKHILTRKQVIFIVIIVILFSTNALSVYPVHRSLEQSDERITVQNIYTLDWMEKNVDKNHSLVVSDHRLERMAEAYSFNTSQDEILLLWSSENISDCINELYGIGKNYTRITHIVIDDIMKNDIVHVGFRKEGINLSYESYHKFSNKSNPVFNLIYTNASIGKNTVTNEPIHWTEVYKVNWTYLEKQYMLDKK